MQPPPHSKFPSFMKTHKGHQWDSDLRAAPVHQIAHEHLECIPSRFLLTDCSKGGTERGDGRVQRKRGFCLAPGPRIKCNLHGPLLDCR